MSSTGARRFGLQGVSRRLPVGVLVLALAALVPATAARAVGPPGTITAAPATNLVDNQTVQLHGSGFSASHLILFGMCLASATDISGCEPNPIGSVFADASGAFNKSVTVHRDITLNPGGPSETLVDCLTTSCALDAADASSSGLGPLTSTNITFADPHLSISIDPDGTLDATTNLATASASVSCTIRTPVFVVGTVTQPVSDPTQTGVQGAFIVPDIPTNTQYCAPGSPLHAFIPTRSFDYQHRQFVLGNAAVEIDAQPFVSLGVAQATVVANLTVRLLDYDTIVAALQAAVANPSNTALRLQLLHDLQTRISQDSTFRREWIALLGH